MHYVILITHQSDIKICTTNFQACLLASHTIRIPIRAQYVCATRRSLITFPFFFSKPAIAPRARFTLQRCIYCTYRYDCRNGFELLRYAHFAKTSETKKRNKKKLFKSWRVNLKNRGKVKVILLLLLAVKFYKFLSLHRTGLGL